MILHSTCLGFARVTVVGCSSGVVHAVSPAVRQDAKAKIITVFLYLSWADLDVEVASLIGDLEDFRPGESIDPETVSVDEQTVGAHAEHYVNSL